MNIVLTLCISFLPLIAYFLYSSVRLRGAYVVPAIFGILAGCIALVPILLLQAVTPHLYDDFRGIGALFVNAFITSALVEETAKTLVLFLIPAGLIYRFAVPKRLENGVRVFFAVSVTAGLAFGGFETIAYILTGFAGLRAVVLRLATAVLFHGVTAGLDGLFVWQVKRRKTTVTGGAAESCAAGLRLPLQYGCLITSVILHGLYNFFTAAGGWFLAFSVICIASAVIRCIFYLRRIQSGL